MKSKIKNSKEPVCISLLKAFSEKEIEGFSVFIVNAYFNTDKVIPKLLQMLKKDVLRHQSYDQVQESRLYSSIFNENLTLKQLSKAQKNRLNSKYNSLTRLAERFLCINAIEHDTSIKNKLLYKELLSKKQYALFNRHINKEKKVLEGKNKIDLEFHNNALIVEEAVLNYAHQTSNVGEVSNLNNYNYQLDVQYILKKLSLYITMLANENIAEKKYDKASMQVISEIIQLSKYKNHALINLNKSTVNLIIEQNKSTFNNLLSQLDKEWKEITIDDLNAFYNVCINYCVQQIRKGENMYQYIFDIYKLMHEKDLLIEGNVFPESKLKIIVAVCCRVKEFKWAEKIINGYQQYIRKPIRDSVSQFHYGAIAFYQKEYSSALNHFIRVDSININYDVNCRVLMLQSHYEVDADYDERTLQIFRSAEKYFYENKVLTSQAKKGYRNFIRTLINLYRIKHFATKMTKERLKQKLLEQEFNSDKNWLLQKIDELK